MEIISENVHYSENHIESIYDYNTTFVEKSNGKVLVSIIMSYINSLHNLDNNLEIHTKINGRK